MKRENFFLKLYAISLTLILAFLFLTSLKPVSSIQKFDEITVERINIVEPDGKLKMVLSNQVRQHPGMIDGNLFPERQRPPGILFFNEEQDEVGGLAYYGNQEEGGNQVFLSFDQYKNDQVMQLMEYTAKDGSNRYGLQLWERDKALSAPQILQVFDSLDREGYNYRQKLEFLKQRNGGEPITAPRLFLGRDYDRATGMFLQDTYGTDRLRIYLDKDNTPRMELLDAQGNLVRDLLGQ